MTEQSLHAERLRVHGSGSACYVMTYDSAENPCWFELKITPRNLARLKQTSASETIDLTAYGTVVNGGWGHVHA